LAKKLFFVESGCDFSFAFIKHYLFLLRAAELFLNNMEKEKLTRTSLGGREY
jgi:hypothetical protein